MKYAFENLDVWQKSKELVKMIYQITESFPSDEKYGIASQIKRASISVSSNIAEGSTRQSKPDQARFYEIAFGSLIEVLNQLIIASELGFLSDSTLKVIRNEIEVLGRMLNALYKSRKPI